jgi:hypothetical protein
VIQFPKQQITNISTQFLNLKLNRLGVLSTMVRHREFTDALQLCPSLRLLAFQCLEHRRRRALRLDVYRQTSSSAAFLIVTVLGLLLVPTGTLLPNASECGLMLSFTWIGVDVPVGVAVAVAVAVEVAVEVEFAVGVAVAVAPVAAS